MGERYDALYQQPWALLPATLVELAEAAAARQAGDSLGVEIEAKLGLSQRGRADDLMMVGSVALIPVYGVLSGRQSLWSWLFGSSAQELSASLRQALEDDAVSAIVLDIDSPGGSTDMIPELAAAIRDARGVKPIAASANTRAASAAYWLAAQADEVSVTPSGDVGSIGIYALHRDLTGLEEMAGIKSTLISAGRYKTEGHPLEPLTDDARAAFQATIDEFYGLFLADVAAGRGVSEQTVRDDYGEGRMLTASQALRAGMVDRVETLEETVARLAGTRPARSAGRGAMTLAAEAQSLQVGAEALTTRLTSLAEVRRGGLTAAKRSALTACTEALREVTGRLDAVLVATDDGSGSPASTTLGLEDESVFARATWRLQI